MARTTSSNSKPQTTAQRLGSVIKSARDIMGSFEGARFCQIRGYLSTLKEQGHNLLNALKQVFLDQPIFLLLA
jgi:hypothetical protein